MLGWSRDQLTPRHSSSFRQPTLFPVDVDTFSVEANVSADEMRRWHNLGWLSFDPADKPRFDEAEHCEVRFVAGLARSGLSDAWIKRLLEPLPKPYCYDPDATLYSFVQNAWVSLPPKPQFDVARELDGYLRDLADNGEWDSLRAIRNTIDSLLDETIAEAEEEDSDVQ